jgi:hypothetical protein
MTKVEAMLYGFPPCGQADTKEENDGTWTVHGSVNITDRNGRSTRKFVARLEIEKPGQWRLLSFSAE